MKPQFFRRTGPPIFKLFDLISLVPVIILFKTSQNQELKKLASEGPMIIVYTLKLPKSMSFLPNYAPLVKLVCTKLLRT